MALPRRHGEAKASFLDDTDPCLSKKWNGAKLGSILARVGNQEKLNLVDNEP
jgi:hypothetical protein